MYKGGGPRVFPIIVAIVVIALIIAALVSVGRLIFLGASTNNKKTDTTTQTVNLRDEVLNTTGERAVRYTVRGPIVADENFRSYQITISPTTRSMTVYRGYLESPLDSKSYDNNAKAYEQFVYALDKANISQTRETKDQDLRGVCATNGRAYKFEAMNAGVTKDAVWTSTCPNSKGSMAANIAQIHALFANQIPDFKPVFDNIQ